VCVVRMEGMKYANEVLADVSEVRRHRTNIITGNRLWAGLMRQVAGFCRHGKKF
jgi:hypothetical protein